MQAATLASIVPVNTAHGAASPQPVMPASVLELQDGVLHRAGDVARTVPAHQANRYLRDMIVTAVIEICFKSIPRFP